jgi:cobalt-zinc-cadmium efflux system outer membrane protein
MSLCRRIPCAMCEALAKMRTLAFAGTIALPFFAGGCSGVANLAGNGVLSATDEEYSELSSPASQASPSETSARMGSTANKLHVPSLMAAENSIEYDDQDQGDAPPDDTSPGDVPNGLDQIGVGNDVGESVDIAAATETEEPNALPDESSLQALAEIQSFGDAPERPDARATSRRSAASNRSPRVAPVDPVSIFDESAIPSASPIATTTPRTPPKRRNGVQLAAKQEEVRGEQRRNAFRSGRADFEPDAKSVMTVEQIVQWTAQNHPQLAAMRAEVGIAEAALVEASLWPNPQLTLDFDSPTQESGGPEISSRVMFTVPMGGKLRLAQEVADIGIRRAQFAVSRETEIAVNESIAAAMEVVYYQELLELRGNLVDIADDLVERLGGDVIPEGDRINAEVNRTDVELERLEASSRLRVARVRLSRAMGLTPPQAIRVRATLPDTPPPDFSLNSLIAAVRENRPEFAEARTAIEEGRRAMTLATAEAVPDLEIGPQFNDTFREPDDSLGGRAQFELPIFSRNQGGIAESSANHQLNRANYRLAEVTTLSDVAEAYAELELIQSQLAPYRDEIPRLAQRAEIAIKRGFEVGIIDSNNMVNELQRLGNLKIRHLDLRYQYNRTRAKIELYAGRSLDQLAAMDAAQRAAEAAADKKPKLKGDEGSPFRDDPDQTEPPKTSPPKKPATENSSAAAKSPAATKLPSTAQPAPRTATPKTTPVKPKERKPAVDTRQARTGNASQVVPASAEGVEASQGFAPLGYVTELFKRDKTPKASDLPYGNAKPSATQK